MTKEIRKYSELSNNENITYQNLHASVFKKEKSTTLATEDSS